MSGVGIIDRSSFHMKSTLLSVLLGAVMLCAVGATAAEKKDITVELEELVTKVKAKMGTGKTTLEDLTPELKQFDKLLAAHKGEKTDEVAQILLMQAMLYTQVLENPEKGTELLKRLKEEFPETTQGKQADTMIAAVAQQAAAIKNRQKLVVGATFPDFQEKDLAGNPLSVAKFKGKVVLIDFWATWCGPCVRELPNVQAAYKKYHDKGFEVIGISLDREEATLKEFIKAKKLPWPQYFDTEGKLGNLYGVDTIPRTYLLDGEGKIVASNIRGEALLTEVGKLIKD